MKTELIDENGIKVWQVWRVPKHFSAWNHRERRWPHPDKMNWKNSPLWKGPFRKTKFSSTKCRSNNLKFLQLNLEEMRQIVSKYQRFSSVQNLIGSVDILMFLLWGHVWLKGYLGISSWELGSVCAKLFGIKSWKTGREIQMKASALSGFSFFP